MHLLNPSGWRARILVLLITALASTPGWTADATFTAPTGTSLAASTRACFSRATVQSGSATSTANGTTTVKIGAVDPATSFLLFGTAHDSSRPVGSEVGGRLLDATTLEFVRATDETTPATISIHWDVVTYACGIAVQRGTATQSGPSTDVTITPVSAMASAFVTYSKVPVATDPTWGDNDPSIAELTTASNLQFRVDAVNPTALHTIHWQVVEFTDRTKISVQRGTTSLATSVATEAITVNAVDPTKSFVLATSRSTSVSAGGATDIGSGMVRAALTNATTVTFDRGATAYGVTEIAWQVVELRDGSTVQRGTGTMAAGVGTANPGISPIPLGRSSAFVSTQTGGGQNGGSTAYTADDVIGVASFTATLAGGASGDPTMLRAGDAQALTVATTNVSLTLQRTSTVAAANYAWFVVSWGYP